MQPYRQQPTKLPHPWGSPGKNTEVGCHFLLQCMKVKSESEVAQSCQTLSDSMDCSLPGSSVHGIFQARVLQWGAIAFSEWACSSSQICFPLFTQAVWLDPSSTFPQSSSPGFFLLKRISCAGQGGQGRGSKPQTDITSLLKNHPSLPALLTNRTMAKPFKLIPISRIISPTLPFGTPCCSYEVPPPHTFCPRLLLSFLFTFCPECASPAGQCFPQLFLNSSYVTP